MRSASLFGTSPVAMLPFSRSLGRDEDRFPWPLPSRAPETVKKCVSMPLFTGEGGEPARGFKFAFAQRDGSPLTPPRSSEESSGESRLSSPLSACDPPPALSENQSSEALECKEQLEDHHVSPFPPQPTPVPLAFAAPDPESVPPKTAKRDLGLGYCANGTNQRTSGTTQRLPKAKSVRVVKTRSVSSAKKTPVRATTRSAHARFERAIRAAEAASKLADEPPRSGKWLPEEDAKLKDAMVMSMELSDNSGFGKWKKVAVLVPGRSSKQCRERWTNQINPDLNNGPWNDEEDEQFIDLVAQLGTKWSEVNAALGTGRADNALKNRYSRLRASGLAPPPPNATAEDDCVEEHCVEDDCVHTAFAEFLADEDEEAAPHASAMAEAIDAAGEDMDGFSSQREATCFDPTACELEDCLEEVSWPHRVALVDVALVEELTVDPTVARLLDGVA